MIVYTLKFPQYFVLCNTKKPKDVSIFIEIIKNYTINNY